jgi:iron-sulfur cluster assembly protein
MALDESKENDDTMEIDDFKFVIDKDFMEKAKSIKVDFSTMGFKLDCGIDFGAGACSSCGSAETGCS